MRKWLGLGTAVVVVFAMSGTAVAARLNWEGTATTRLGDLPDLSASGGGVATVNGSVAPGTPLHLTTIRLAGSRGAVTGTDTVIITDPNVAGNGIAAVEVSFVGRTGTLAPISSAGTLTQRTMPIGGLAKICLVSTVCTDFLPLLLTQPTTNGARFQVATATPNQLTQLGLQGKKLGIPGTGTKGFGIGGLLTVGGESAIRISVEAAPWTIKTATVIDQTDGQAFVNLTGFGFAQGPDMTAGGAFTQSMTARPSGVLQIVTPSQVRTNLSLGSAKKIGVLTEILIHFIPEPGLLLLIGSGIVGLVVLGRSRMQH
jgi:hypothetical protein